MGQRPLLQTILGSPRETHPVGFHSPTTPAWHASGARHLGDAAFAAGSYFSDQAGVERNTSSIVVTPSAIFIVPARRSGRMPSLSA